jgi:hypothetical protein
MADFAEAYADQNEQDRHALIDAIGAGGSRPEPGSETRPTGARAAGLGGLRLVAATLVAGALGVAMVPLKLLVAH